MDPIVAEGIKMMITAAITYAKEKGATDAELDQLVAEARGEYKENKSSLLPDV